MDTANVKGNTKRYDPKESIQRAKRKKPETYAIQIGSTGKKISWSTRMDRVRLIREGLPYEAIEVVSKHLNLPVKQVLLLFGIPQTTYNKKKKDLERLNARDSEMILVLTELLDFGTEVFNNEKEKFQRWLKKPNISLGGVTPESLFDTLTGIQEVRNSLNRLEYGNLA